MGIFIGKEKRLRAEEKVYRLKTYVAVFLILFYSLEQ